MNLTIVGRNPLEIFQDKAQNRETHNSLVIHSGEWKKGRNSRFEKKSSERERENDVLLNCIEKWILSLVFFSRVTVF